jgi:Ca2+/Na+ antiporter
MGMGGTVWFVGFSEVMGWVSVVTIVMTATVTLALLWLERSAKEDRMREDALRAAAHGRRRD